jgi:hypothetical protein
MKFNLPTPQHSPEFDTTLRLGNVYACKGGGKTNYWIVVGMNERTVNLLGINRDGVVTSTASSDAHELAEGQRLYGRELLGRCDGLESLDFDITWMNKP